MTLFGLIRHGQTEYNRQNLFQGSSDIPLNDTGKAQAHEALKNYANLQWDYIASSPLIRAVETAQIIAADHQIPILGSFTGLREVHFGEVEGMNAKDVYSKYLNRDFPGRESANEALARASSTLLELAATYPNARILLVAHGSLLRYIASSITGKSFASFPNASLTELEITLGPEPSESNWVLSRIGGEKLEPAASLKLNQAAPTISAELEAPIIKLS